MTDRPLHSAKYEKPIGLLLPNIRGMNNLNSDGFSSLMPIRYPDEASGPDKGWSDPTHRAAISWATASKMSLPGRRRTDQPPKPNPSYQKKRATFWANGGGTCVSGHNVSFLHKQESRRFCACSCVPAEPGGNSLRGCPEIRQFGWWPASRGPAASGKNPPSNTLAE